MSKYSKDKKKKGKFKRILGNLVFTTFIIYLMPKIIEKGESYLYSKKKMQIEPLDDDWGPEIVKTSSLKEN